MAVPFPNRSCNKAGKVWKDQLTNRVTENVFDWKSYALNCHAGCSIISPGSASPRWFRGGPVEGGAPETVSQPIAGPWRAVLRHRGQLAFRRTGGADGAAPSTARASCCQTIVEPRLPAHARRPPVVSLRYYSCRSAAPLRPAAESAVGNSGGPRSRNLQRTTHFDNLDRANRTVALCSSRWRYSHRSLPA